MNRKAQRAAALKAAQDIIAGAKASARDLSSDEVEALKGHQARIEELDTEIKAAEEADALMKSIGSMGGAVAVERDGDEVEAKTLGDHFVKSVGADGLSRLKNTSGYTLGAPEFEVKAPGPHTTTPYGNDWLQQVDKTILHPFRRQPIVADLLGSGTMSGTSIKYFIEGLAVDGNFQTVAETGQKPQMQFPVPTSKVDGISKLAAWWDNSDEMIEDLPFMVSEINNRGLYMLSMVEEAQLLSGDGTGTNLLGLLNRSGLQLETSAAAADDPDAVFRASAKVQQATGLTSDGVILNPMDYQRLRLMRDSNGQYFGGGFFYGEYGNTGVVEQPPLWGLRTVVTAAIPQGTFLTGALKAATTVYRKGGIRVESTNSDQGKFTTNIVTTRIEERIGLAVRNPTAIVKGTFAA